MGFPAFGVLNHFSEKDIEELHNFLWGRIIEVDHVDLESQEAFHVYRYSTSRRHSMITSNGTE